MKLFRTVVYVMCLFTICGSAVAADKKWSKSFAPAKERSGELHPDQLKGKKVWGVGEFACQARKGDGPVVIEGEVSSVYAKKKKFVMVDPPRADANCCNLRFPVLWKGTLPAKRALVQVSGTVGIKNKRLVFLATEVVEK